MFLTFMLIKTFFFLRIFQNFTKLVIMIKRVIFDLKEFIIFYLLLLTMLSVIMGVLGVGNPNAIRDEHLRARLKEARAEGGHSDDDFVNDFPGYEYGTMNEFAKNIFTILRFSLGDFDFQYTAHLSTFERNVFWFTWVVIVIMTCVIFLNFIIAEVSESYQKVTTQVEELIL